MFGQDSNVFSVETVIVCDVASKEGVLIDSEPDSESGCKEGEESVWSSEGLWLGS